MKLQQNQNFFGVLRKSLDFHHIKKNEEKKLIN
jgi:hypothetical protein